jgi:hypothetical protein
MGRNSGPKLGSLSARGNIFRAVQSKWKAGVEEFENNRVLSRQTAASGNDTRTSCEVRIDHSGLQWKDVSRGRRTRIS